MVSIKALMSLKVSFKSAVRMNLLKTLSGNGQSIQGAENHAKRLDPISQKRSIHPENKPIAWSKAGLGKELDYVEAFKAHKKEFSASERGGAAPAMEFKLVISPEWLQENGDPHDPNNPCVKALFENAKEWAESWGGQGAVWGLRYDTDEAGSGVVDVFMSPIREQKHRSGRTKQVISCNKAKEELLEQEKALDASLKTSGAAMQSSWARWCQERLDPRIKRGERKELTGNEHIHMDKFKEIAEKAKIKGKMEANKEISLSFNRLVELENKLIAQKNALDKKQKELEEAAQAQKEREAKLKSDELLIKHRKSRLQAEQQDFEKEQEKANNIIKRNRAVAKMIPLLLSEDIGYFVRWGFKVLGFQTPKSINSQAIPPITDAKELIDFKGFKEVYDFLEYEHSVVEICQKTYDIFSVFMEKIANYIKKNVENDIESATHALIGFLKAFASPLMQTVTDVKEELLEFSDNEYSYLEVRVIYESFQNDELLKRKERQEMTDQFLHSIRNDIG